MAKNKVAPFFSGHGVVMEYKSVLAAVQVAASALVHIR